VVNDISVQDFIAVNKQAEVFVPHTAARYQMKRFRKAQCPLVERLVNALMRKARNNGKKFLGMKIVQQALEIVALTTDQNPLQVLVTAVVNAGPREDSTRIGAGGIVRRQAVDVSHFRRVNQAIYQIGIGAREASFRTIKTAAEVSLGRTPIGQALSPLHPLLARAPPPPLSPTHCTPPSLPPSLRLRSTVLG
jgi:small subunit ribosomal protein S5e